MVVVVREKVKLELAQRIQRRILDALDAVLLRQVGTEPVQASVQAYYLLFLSFF